MMKKHILTAFAATLLAVSGVAQTPDCLNYLCPAHMKKVHLVAAACLLLSVSVCAQKRCQP